MHLDAAAGRQYSEAIRCESARGGCSRSAYRSLLKRKENVEGDEKAGEEGIRGIGDVTTSPFHFIYS